MIPENGNCTLDTILEGILTEGEDVEEAVRTMRSDLLRAAMPTMPTLRPTMPIITLPANLNVKAEQPDSCSESMVSPKNVLLVCSDKIHWILCEHVVARLAQLFSFGRQRHSSLNLVLQFIYK